MQTEKKYVEASTAAEVIGNQLGISLAEMCDIMGNVPAADVVKVVRCKDCEHRRESGVTSRNWCTYHEDDTGLIEVHDNDFCSYGERKEDGTTDNR